MYKIIARSLPEMSVFPDKKFLFQPAATQTPLSAEDERRYREAITRAWDTAPNLIPAAIRTLVTHLLDQANPDGLPEPFRLPFSGILTLYQCRDRTGMAPVVESSVTTFIENAAPGLIRDALKSGQWNPAALRLLGDALAVPSPQSDFFRIRIENGKVRWRLYHAGSNTWYAPKPAPAEVQNQHPNTLIQYLTSCEKDDENGPFADLLPAQFLQFKQAGKRTPRIKGTYFENTGQLYLDRSRVHPGALRKWDVGPFGSLPMGSGLERDHIPQDAWLEAKSTARAALIMQKNQIQAQIAAIYHQTIIYHCDAFIRELLAWNGGDNGAFKTLLNDRLKNPLLMAMLEGLHQQHGLFDIPAWTALKTEVASRAQFRGDIRMSLVGKLQAFKQTLDAPRMTAITAWFSHYKAPSDGQIAILRNQEAQIDRNLEALKKTIQDEALAIAVPADYHSKYSRTYMKRGKVTAERLGHTLLQELVLDQKAYFDEVPGLVSDLTAIGAFRVLYRQTVKLKNVDGSEIHDRWIIAMLDSQKNRHPI